MDIAYVARTRSSTLLLDADGVCIRVEGRGTPAETEGAKRCIGAQFVATLDSTAHYGLGSSPKVGAPMIFAATGGDGRIFLVRTGPLTSFQEVWSGVYSRETPKAALAPAKDSRPSQTDPVEIFIEVDEDEDEGETVPYRRERKDSRRLYVPPPYPSGETTEHETPPARASTYPPPRRSTIPPPRPRAAAAFGAPPPRTFRASSPPPPLPFPIPITRIPPPPSRPSRDAPPSPPTIVTPLRRRAPAPSSHAWLRDSPAAVVRRVK